MPCASLFREVQLRPGRFRSRRGVSKPATSPNCQRPRQPASRTIAMISRYRDGVVPEAGPDPLLRRISKASTAFPPCWTCPDRAGPEEIWVLVRRPQPLLSRRRSPLVPPGRGRRRTWLDVFPSQPGRGAAGVLTLLPIPHLPGLHRHPASKLAELDQARPVWYARGRGRSKRLILFPGNLRNWDRRKKAGVLQQELPSPQSVWD